MCITYIDFKFPKFVCVLSHFSFPDIRKELANFDFYVAISADFVPEIGQYRTRNGKEV